MSDETVGPEAPRANRSLRILETKRLGHQLHNYPYRRQVSTGQPFFVCEGRGAPLPVGLVFQH